MAFDVLELSQQEFSSMLRKFLKDNQFGITEALSAKNCYNHGFYEHENKTISELRNSDKHTNSAFTISHDNINLLLVDALWLNKEKIYNWLISDMSKSQYKLDFNIEYSFPLGIGFIKHDDTMYVSNGLSFVLTFDEHKPPGFEMRTYYPDILHHRQEVNADYGYINMYDIINEYNLK